MEIKGSFSAPAATAAVWEFLSDPPRLGACVPGCEELQPAGEGRYQGALKVKVGPIHVRFQGELGLLEASPPDRLVARIKGADRVTGSQAEMNIAFSLAPADGDAGPSTRVEYTAAVRLVGRLANYGHGIVRTEAEKMLREFGRRVGEALRAPGGEHVGELSIS